MVEDALAAEMEPEDKNEVVATRLGEQGLVSPAAEEEDSMNGEEGKRNQFEDGIHEESVDEIETISENSEAKGKSSSLKVTLEAM